MGGSVQGGLLQGVEPHTRLLCKHNTARLFYKHSTIKCCCRQWRILHQQYDVGARFLPFDGNNAHEATPSKSVAPCALHKVGWGRGGWGEGVRGRGRGGGSTDGW